MIELFLMLGTRDTYEVMKDSTWIADAVIVYDGALPSYIDIKVIRGELSLKDIASIRHHWPRNLKTHPHDSER